MRQSKDKTSATAEGDTRVLEQDVILQGAPAGVDPAAYAERLAQQLMAERAEALISQEQMRLAKAAKYGDAFVTADGRRVMPKVAFIDSVDEDGTEMTSEDGTPADIHPGWVTRWVRVEVDQWGRQNYGRVKARKRAGWVPVMDKTTGKPLERPGYCAMQAHPQHAAQYTASRTPAPSSGIMKDAAQVRAVRSIERVRVGFDDQEGG